MLQQPSCFWLEHNLVKLDEESFLHGSIELLSQPFFESKAASNIFSFYINRVLHCWSQKKGIVYVIINMKKTKISGGFLASYFIYIFKYLSM